MVCIRDPSRRNTAISNHEIATTEVEESAYKESFMGFSLLDASGKHVALLDTQGTFDVGNGYLAIKAEVNPGSFSLSYRRGQEAVCFSLPTSEGWTTQVYLNVVSPDAKSYSLLPDLAGMAIVFDRLSANFFDLKQEFVAEETIRQGLIDGRNYLSPESMQHLLDGKYENPMLGIYAGYLLLDEQPPKIDLASTVVGNTERLLGSSFPDIAALKWAVARAKASAPTSKELEAIKFSLAALEGPPILARSWDVLLEVSKLLAVSASFAIPVFRFAEDLVDQGGLYVAWSHHAYSARKELLSNTSNEAGANSAAGALTVLKKLRRMSRRLSRRPSDQSSVAVVIDAVAAPVISAAARIATIWRRFTRGNDAPPLAARIGTVQDEEQAARVLAELAKKYAWDELVSALRKYPGAAAGLSGFQRDLMLTLRDATLETDEPVNINAIFVRRLLDVHRVPLSSLVEALSIMELSGWLPSTATNLLTDAVQKRSQVAAQRQARTPLRLRSLRSWFAQIQSNVTTAREKHIVGLIATAAACTLVLAIALPAYQDYTIRSRVSEGVALADGLTTAINEYYATHGTLPSSNYDVGLQSAQITWESTFASIGPGGEITVAFAEKTPNRQLVYSPIVSADGIKWTCSSPNIPAEELPAACRTQ